MLLPQQIQAILYHLMMGWCYGCTFSFLCSLTVYLRFKLIKGIAEILFHIAFILLAFHGLYGINGGITNIYLTIIFLFGVLIYYKWYLPVFTGFFRWFIRLFRPVKRKLHLAKMKLIGIIIIRRKKRAKRRAEHEKRKKKKRKQKEAIQSDEEVL